MPKEAVKTLISRELIVALSWFFACSYISVMLQTLQTLRVGDMITHLFCGFFSHFFFFDLFSKISNVFSVKQYIYLFVYQSINLAISKKSPISLKMLLLII